MKHKGNNILICFGSGDKAHLKVYFFFLLGSDLPLPPWDISLKLRFVRHSLKFKDYVTILNVNLPPRCATFPENNFY